MKTRVEAAYHFGPTYFHLRAGGHVVAMHHHRANLLFVRIDIANIFYSVSRRRVESAIGRIGIAKADFFARWSTVVNHMATLPYGFVQSPILASFVLATSDVGAHLANLPASVAVSVYIVVSPYRRTTISSCESHTKRRRYSGGGRLFRQRREAAASRTSH